MKVYQRLELPLDLAVALDDDNTHLYHAIIPNWEESRSLDIYNSYRTW
jgi:hypothetical protein